MLLMGNPRVSQVWAGRGSNIGLNLNSSFPPPPPTMENLRWVRANWQKDLPRLYSKKIYREQKSR
jgi:hypothetical protein